MSFRWIWAWLNQHAGWLCLAGLGLVALWNWRAWRRDRALAGRIRAQEPEPVELGTAPRVSVLVAAWNEAELIEGHIESFLALRFPNKELILCAGGSDSTHALARRYAGESVTVLEQQPGEGKQAALRRCLERAMGEIIYLTDADSLLDDQPFERVLALLIDGGEEAATGRFAPLRRQRGNPFVLMQWYVDNFGRARAPNYVEGLIGRNAAIHRSVLDRSGGFSADVATGTDYYLACQLLAAGVRIRYVADSLVETEFVTAIRPYLRQQSRWLRNILFHGRAFGAVHQVRSALAQCLAGTVFLLWPLAFPFTGGLGLGLWLVVWFHGVLSRYRYMRFGEVTLRQPRRASLYLLAPLYLLLDQVMLSWALLEWLLPATRRRW